MCGFALEDPPAENKEQHHYNHSGNHSDDDTFAGDNCLFPRRISSPSNRRSWHRRNGFAMTLGCSARRLQFQLNGFKCDRSLVSKSQQSAQKVVGIDPVLPVFIGLFGSIGQSHLSFPIQRNVCLAHVWRVRARPVRDTSQRTKLDRVFLERANPIRSRILLPIEPREEVSG